MVSLATNHTLDKGESGVLNFYNYWKNKNDIMFNAFVVGNIIYYIVH